MYRPGYWAEHEPFSGTGYLYHYKVEEGVEVPESRFDLGLGSKSIGDVINDSKVIQGLLEVPESMVRVNCMEIVLLIVFNGFKGESDECQVKRRTALFVSIVVPNNPVLNNELAKPILELSGVYRRVQLVLHLYAECLLVQAFVQHFVLLFSDPTIVNLAERKTIGAFYFQFH